jgi:upstream activation factor subunit UAF30
MPRQSKTTAKTADAPVAEPVVNTAAAPVAETKTKKPRATKAASPAAEPAPVAVAPVAEVAETHAEEATSDFAAKSSEFMTKLNQLSSVIATLKTEYRTLEKQMTKELKAAQKTSSKKKRKSGNRAPSGFVKPARISNELATFLGKASGTEMARTDVTREINQYIRSHNLQDKDNGRKIIPDAKLKSLLKLKDTDELTYFNLQRYMSPHFTKTAKPTTTA